MQNCVNGSAAHRMDNTCGVVCRTENCVNGPEPHVFELDVERPVDAQPDRCQPADWVNRHTASTIPAVRPADPYNTHFCKVVDCINTRVEPDAHRTLNVVPHAPRDDCRSLSPARPLSAHVEVDRNGADLDPTTVPAVRPLRDDPIETNAEGGSQSVIAETFTTFPLRALRALSQLSRLGDERYGEHNWRKIPERDHIDHAFAHMLGHSSGDDTEDHLLHAAWRLVAALEVHLTKKENPDG